MFFYYSHSVELFEDVAQGLVAIVFACDVGKFVDVAVNHGVEPIFRNTSFAVFLDGYGIFCQFLLRIPLASEVSVHVASLPDSLCSHHGVALSNPSAANTIGYEYSISLKSEANPPCHAIVFTERHDVLES